MLRVAGIALALMACGKSATNEKDKATAPPTGESKIAVPRGGEPVAGAPTEGSVGAAKGTNDQMSPAALERAKDPRFHIKPDEGTLTVGTAEAKVGAPATAEIKIVPAAGFHVSLNYNTKLQLQVPAGVKLDKTLFMAGGRNEAQGDAAEFSEKGLSFKVTATAESAGPHEIQGVMSFGICENDSCRPRTQPITIQVAAK